MMHVELELSLRGDLYTAYLHTVERLLVMSE